jgi:hypothetical protein
VIASKRKQESPDAKVLAKAFSYGLKGLSHPRPVLQGTLDLLIRSLISLGGLERELSRMSTTEGFDLVAKELAQRNPKLRDVDTKSVVDLQFVRELEQSGFLKSLKGN